MLKKGISMIQKIKNLIMVAFLPLAVAVPLAFAGPVSAACVETGTPGGTSSIKEGVNSGINAATSGNCETGASDTAPSLPDLAAKIVNILSLIIGIVAVIMIVYAGFRYITSGGESGNVSGAKNTLIYAIVGLIIVALAQFIVRFVLNGVDSTVTSVILF